MKKIIITSILSLLFGLFVLAQTKKKAAAKPGKQTVSQASLQRGQIVYKSTCVACHQQDGGGVPRLNPPLIKTEYVLGDKARLINIVLKGLNETIEVDGEEYTNAMPSFAQLDDQEIADVLTYVRNSFGNKASAVSATQVKALRAQAK